LQGLQGPFWTLQLSHKAISPSKIRELQGLQGLQGFYASRRIWKSQWPKQQKRIGLLAEASENIRVSMPTLQTLQTLQNQRNLFWEAKNRRSGAVPFVKLRKNATN
jgi:hypothetical protein